jgi:hypothetical protein
LSQNQTVLAAITDKPILGYGVLGGVTSGKSALTYSVDISGISNPQHLVVGLLDPIFTDSGFDSLEFSILGQGNMLFDQTFSFSEAQSFFDDHVIDLGSLSDIVGSGLNLNLAFNFSLEGANNSGFDFNFIFADPSPTPIPGAVWLFGSGLIGIIAFRRKFFG